MEWFLLITNKKYILIWSTNFISRNHSMLCFWLRRDQYRSSRSQMFFKIGALKNLLVNIAKFLLWTSILKNICNGCISNLLKVFFDHETLSFWICYEKLILLRDCINAFVEEELKSGCRYGSKNNLMWRFKKIRVSMQEKKS